MFLAYIGVGSNLGQRQENISSAEELIRSIEGIEFLNSSSVIETIPLGGPPQGKFLNAVFEIKTVLSPEALLNTLQEIEQSLGRERGIKWGPRKIDLDILFYGNKIINKEDLQIPHPLLHKRRFVLEPLCQLNPSLEHPVLKKQINNILEELDENCK